MPSRVLVGSLLGAVALLLIGGPALATTDLATQPAAPMTDPFDVGGADITDQTASLSASERAEMQTAMDGLETDRGTRLVIVIVDDFSGVTDDVEWANETAIDSNLPASDVLLAISTDSDTAYWSVDTDFPVGDDRLETIRTEDVLPALRDGDLVAAVVGFADGLNEAQAPSPVPWIVGGVVVVGGVAGGAIYGVRRRRATKRDEAATLTARQDLDTRAGTVLVELDDALKTSEQELGFAQAQFGDDSTRDFATALASAQATAKQAFELRQKLDDAFPETPEQHRAMTLQLIELAGQADAVLDAQAEKFDELRQLEKNAPQVLEQVESERAGLAGLIDAAESTLASMRTQFPQADLTAVADAPAQARKLDTFAVTAVAKAREAIASGPEGTAAVAVRAAQQAVGQAQQLAGAVASRQSELVAQQERNAAAVRELEHEVADARAQITTAQDYITTHRGAVASTARTRISEAQRHLDVATGLAAADAVAAVAEAVQADKLAASALASARADVDQYERAQNPGSADAYSYDDGSDGAGLGGILGDLFGGGGGSWGSSGGSSHSSGGGGWSWGGGSSSGGFGGSSRRSSSSGGMRRSSSGGGSRRSSGGGRRR